MPGRMNWVVRWVVGERECKIEDQIFLYIRYIIYNMLGGLFFKVCFFQNPHLYIKTLPSLPSSLSLPLSLSSRSRLFYSTPLPRVTESNLRGFLLRGTAHTHSHAHIPPHTHIHTHTYTHTHSQISLVVLSRRLIDKGQ